MSTKINLLFVCIENSNRSQMAEAFAKIHSNGRINAFSAGSRPSGFINPKAMAVMKIKGLDLSRHKSKSVEEFRHIVFDYVVTMGCGDECPFIPAKYRIDWQIPDPKNLPENEVLEVCNMIEDKVKALVKEIAFRV